MHSKLKVIHSLYTLKVKLSTVNFDLHTGYPQFINSLYSITLSGWLIELIAVYTVESIVNSEAPIYTVYTESHSAVTVYTVPGPHCMRCDYVRKCE